jgi:hypothetical protein
MSKPMLVPMICEIAKLLFWGKGGIVWIAGGQGVGACVGP